MILIADSGSSKTDWLLLKEDGEKTFESKGINPFFQNTEKIYHSLKPVFQEERTNTVSHIFFYGAGCIKDKTDGIVLDALRKLFSSAEITVNDDMLGAARCLLGKQRGIACILGTGANSCYYDGSEIKDKVPTLGFILGDEGSGAHIGKLFLNDYFKRAIPVELKNEIKVEMKDDMPEVLAAVYKGEYPSRYLARFAKLLSKYRSHPYAQELIERSFNAFFFRNIERYENYKELEVNFIGSIAFYYSGILKKVASQRGIKIGKIIEKPITGLKTFHSKLEQK